MMIIQDNARPPLISDERLSRRRFVQGAVAAGLATGPFAVRAAPGIATTQAVLSGNDIQLEIAPAAVNFTGRQRVATVVNGQLPAPLLRWREGERVRIRVSNRLREMTSIHWHGLLVPVTMDGSPNFGFSGIAPDESFEYQFQLRQAGTYWYHSHSGFQDQRGLYGPLVVVPREGDRDGIGREHVVMLSDWSDTDPRRIAHRLKVQADYYDHNQRTVGDFFRDVRRHGLGHTVADRLDWGKMRMSPSDLADVGGRAYTFLMNGRTPAANWTGLYQPGERVRLRFINGAAMTYFDVRIPGLGMTILSADGQPVEPVTVDELRLGPGETCDVAVRPADGAAYTVFAQSMDRSGYARGTLAPRAGMSAAVPDPDPRVLLTMADVGHAGHGEHGAGRDRGDHDASPGHDSHDGHDAATAVHHLASEYGSTVDMRVAHPSARLDDPGVGLRDNGRRVLTYADLASRFPDPDGREPGRTVELHLTGHMHRYQWSFNGVPYSRAEPLRLVYGERVRIRLVNDTMMEHPIHLHGMWSDLEGEAGAFQLRKHTLSLKPAQMLNVRVSAGAPGRWPMHCHLMLHMVLGMFREVIVDGELRDV